MSSHPKPHAHAPTPAKPSEGSLAAPEAPLRDPLLAFASMQGTGPRTLTPRAVMQLQRAFGNRVVAQWLQPQRASTSLAPAVETQQRVALPLLQAKFAPPGAIEVPSVATPPLSHDREQRAVGEVVPRQPLPTPRHPELTLRPLSPDPERMLQGKFTYASGVVLERGGGTERTADQFTVETVALPEKARPPTQFGREQKAHSVSWTLVRRAYQEVGNRSPKITAKAFIEQYLIPDWSALAKQKDLAGSRDEHETFMVYLDKYKAGKLTGWKTATYASLQWHQLLQEAVRDYFLAFQLAPLSTHTGFTQKQGGSSEGVKESRPSSHGEPAANKFFTQLENSIKGVEKAPTEKAMAKLTKHALAYWDPGIGMVGGINDPKQVATLFDEYKKNFLRAYPLTWLIHGGKIVSAVEAEIKEALKRAGSHGKSAEKEEEEEETPEVEAEAEGEEEVSTDPGGFAAQLGLSTTGATAVNASGFTVKELRLPDDRPPTKYGPLGQKSHTVSWTLVLKGLRQLALNQPLTAFLQTMLAKWQTLAAQPWEAMQTTNLIALSDYKGLRKPTGATVSSRNKENKARLRAIRASISLNMQAIANALGGQVHDDLEWATLVQQMVGDYVVAYQSAPFTAFKSREGTPKGHGEPDSNRVFGVLDQDTAAAVGDEWLQKLKNLYKGLVYQGHDPADALITAPLIAKVNRDTPLEPEERESLRAVVVKELALNYLDTEWNALRVNGALTLATAPRAMARIVVEWEELLQAAYPRIWAKYKHQFEAYSNQLKLPESLLEQKAEEKGVKVEELKDEDTRMKDTMKAQRNENDYQRGLIAARTGNTAVVDTDAVFFAQAKAEYLAGLNAIRGGTPDHADSRGATSAKEEYRLGEIHAIAGNGSLIGTHAYKHAKTDYQQGVNAARLGQPKGTGAQATGYDQYQSGVEAAKTKNPALAGGHQLGHADFTAGFNDHSGGLVQLPQHFNHTGYMAGWAQAQKLADRDEEVVSSREVQPSAKKKSRIVVGDNN